MTKFKVGDKVKIHPKHILMKYGDNASWGLTPSMLRIAGTLATIKDVRDDYDRVGYELDNIEVNGLYWDDSWLESAFQPTLLDDTLFEA